MSRASTQGCLTSSRRLRRAGGLLAVLLAAAAGAAAEPAAAEPSNPSAEPSNAAAERSHAAAEPLPAVPPAGAAVLFDDGSTCRFASKDGGPPGWPVVEGALVASRGPRHERANHLVSLYHFRDAYLHVEFVLPAEGPGNSGVYVHGNYELQILNSAASATPTDQEMGAIYGFFPPRSQAARPPGVWQTYAIRYRAPRRDAEGALVEPGRITAWLNGVEVQRDAEVGEPRSAFHPFRYQTTPYLAAIADRQRRTSAGPVFLQDHDSPVRFRNVWVLPLDDRGGWYDADPPRAERPSAAAR